MILRDLLTKKRRPVCMVDSEKTVAEAVTAMAAARETACIVVRSGMPEGLFGVGDVLRCGRGGGTLSLEKVPLHQMMNRLLPSHPEETVSDAVAKMIRCQMEHLPVMEGDLVLGIFPLVELAALAWKTLCEERDTLQGYIRDLHEAFYD